MRLTQQFITDRLPDVREFCRAHYVQRSSIFGSAVRDDFNLETSDVDVRVAFLPEASGDYLKNLYAIRDTLPVLFGRKVGCTQRNDTEHLPEARD